LGHRGLATRGPVVVAGKSDVAFLDLKPETGAHEGWPKLLVGGGIGIAYYQVDSIVHSYNTIITHNTRVKS
jgi:hypothetical protein